ASPCRGGPTRDCECSSSEQAEETRLIIDQICAVAESAVLGHEMRACIIDTLSEASLPGAPLLTNSCPASDVRHTSMRTRCATNPRCLSAGGADARAVRPVLDDHPAACFRVMATPWCLHAVHRHGPRAGPPDGARLCRRGDLHRRRGQLDGG